MWKHSLSLSADTSLCQSMKQFSVEDKELLSRVWWYEAGKTVPLKAQRAPPWMRERLLRSRGVAWSFWREEQRARAGEAGQSQRTTHRAVLSTRPSWPASVQTLRVPAGTLVITNAFFYDVLYLRARTLSWLFLFSEQLAQCLRWNEDLMKAS